MNREEVEVLQGVGIRVEQVDEPCGHCGRPSVYDRRTDRYYHVELGAPNLPCWVAISSGQTPMKHAVSQSDSLSSARCPIGPETSGRHRHRAFRRVRAAT